MQQITVSKLAKSDHGKLARSPSLAQVIHGRKTIFTPYL